MSRKCTAKQRKQQALSWKLRMVLGAKGTCSTYWHENQMLPLSVRQKLEEVRRALDGAEDIIRHELENIR